MTDMFEGDVAIKRLKAQARKLKREIKCSHTKALDKIAIEKGFINWAELYRAIKTEGNVKWLTCLTLI
jgi:hypothetical protein